MGGWVGITRLYHSRILNVLPLPEPTSLTSISSVVSGSRRLIFASSSLNDGNTNGTVHVTATPALAASGVVVECRLYDAVRDIGGASLMLRLATYRHV